MIDAMNTVRLNSKDFVDDGLSVVESASRIAAEASRLLRSGSNVVVSVHGVRGVSSSFFNVILAAVADALLSEGSAARFQVETETITQRTIYQRSFDAFFPGRV